MSSYTFGTAMEGLKASQKPAARSAPAYSRFVNRKLGRPLAALCAVAGATPNQVTMISALCTWAAIAVLAVAQPTWATGLVVTALLVLGYALDSADGQLARLQHSGSPAGEWLDHVVDAVKTVALPLAVLLGLRRGGVVDVWLGVPMVSAVVNTVLFFAMILTEQLRRAHGVRSVADPGEGAMQWLRAVLVLPMDYGVLCWSFVLLGATGVFLTVYTLITLGTTLFLLAAVVRWYREMKGLGAAA